MTEREAFDLGYRERAESWPAPNPAGANFQNEKMNMAYAAGVRKFDEERKGGNDNVPTKLSTDL